MDLKETIKARGDVLAECFDENGEAKWTERMDNAIMNGGFTFMANAMFASSSRPNVVNRIAIGSGNTAVTATQTSLTTELARGAATYSVSGKVATLTHNFAAGTGTGTVREVGLFNATSAGTMLARALLSADRVKGSGDSLRITYNITLSQQ